MIMITAYRFARGTRVQALKAGAYDYLTKPVDPAQFRRVVASRPPGCRMGPPRTWSQRDRQGRPAPRLAEGGRRRGSSPAGLGMQQVRKASEQVARSMAPVLVHGESGTGKGLVMSAVHRGPGRRAFHRGELRAIPEHLLESGFFGYRKARVHGGPGRP